MGIGASNVWAFFNLGLNAFEDGWVGGGGGGNIELTKETGVVSSWFIEDIVDIDERFIVESYKSSVLLVLLAFEAYFCL